MRTLSFCVMLGSLTVEREEKWLQALIRLIFYRPPIEAETFLLPITEGCTHNSCSFCNMYQGIPFRMLPLTEVEAYLQEVNP